MSSYRLMLSVANVHNFLLVSVILAFIVVSFLPFTNRPPSIRVKEGEIELVPGDDTRCQQIDFSPYDNLVSKYEQLRSEYETTNKILRGEMESKSAILISTASDVDSLKDHIQKLVQDLNRHYLTLAARIEKVQRRIAVPRNTTFVQEIVKEISGSCPLFQMENNAEYGSLMGKLRDIENSIGIFQSQYDNVVDRAKYSSQLIRQISKALPVIKSNLDAVRSQPAAVQPTMDLSAIERKIAAIAQNEVHDQWKAAKSSPEAFSEIYKLSTETFEAIVEKWRMDLKAKDVEQSSKREQKKASKAPPMQVKTEWAHTTADERDVTPIKDFALLSAGASIVTTDTSNTFIPAVSSVTANAGVLGFLSHKVSKSFLGGSPEDALSPTLVRGSCWPMQGSTGNLTVQLAHPVIVEAITLDHFMDAADKSSALRTFHVFGKADDGVDSSWHKLLSWEEFDVSKGKMTFAVPSGKQGSCSQVRLEIVENYGHPEYTCIYRFRVHGSIA